MSEPTKPPSIFSDALRTELKEILREVIRSELEAAKKQELPKLLYDTADAAQILSVPKSWLSAKARAGEIKVSRMGHYVLFTLEDLQEFARRNRDT